MTGALERGVFQMRFAFPFSGSRTSDVGSGGDASDTPQRRVEGANCHSRRAARGAAPQLLLAECGETDCSCAAGGSSVAGVDAAVDDDDGGVGIPNSSTTSIGAPCERSSGITK